uniref:Tyrosine-protein kinase ephrin type A/B receptor-like domain-containing protein n=1 Tax=Ditylenchus dipsaci TaxID=166011 RepID=A0A915DMT8_9BILA
MRRIQQLNSNWNICASPSTATNNSCQNVKIFVDCNDGENLQSNVISSGNRIDADAVRSFLSRHRRQQSSASSDQLFGVSIEIPIKQVIQNEALSKDLFNLEQVLPNGRPDLRSFAVKNVFNCNQGSVAVRDNCVPCAKGTYFDESSEKCVLCAIGQYQPDVGQSSCIACPARTPATEGIGSIMVSECRVKCEPGHFLNVQHNSCEPCGYGFYQPLNGAFECLACGIGKTTLEPAATDEEDCRDECPDGQQLIKAGTCQPCPMGTYRSKGVDKQCQECPPEQQPKCMPGQFLVTANKQCQFCPRGAYQDEPFKLTASSVLLITPLKLKEQLTKCVDLPDKDDIASYQCICLPGYVGNGTYCKDACINRCLNDGISKNAYITAGIGGVVLLLILIVVVIWMISFRFNRHEHDLLRGLEKPTIHHLDSPMSSNFLYGRPALADRAHSSLGGTLRQPIGFYYEDDAAYEQSQTGGVPGSWGSTDDQTITDASDVGGRLEGQRQNNGLYTATQVRASAMPYSVEFGNTNSTSASKELEQRLRHVQQHIYRPSREERD